MPSRQVRRFQKIPPSSPAKMIVVARGRRHRRPLVLPGGEIL
jgi:hypothetical protein